MPGYNKNIWVDQEVERPRTYEMINNSDGSVTLIDSPGLVSELGTPVNADNMNHIEEGIENCELTKWNENIFYSKQDLATYLVDGEKKIFSSLRDENQGHLPTDTEWWEEKSFGGESGGFELGDIGTALYIDETKGLRRYLNGQLVAINSNTTAFLNYLKKVQTIHPALFVTEEDWQAELASSDKGQCGKFVIATEESTVRLPAIVNIQGLMDLANLGVRVQAGLPNITGNLLLYGADPTEATGAFSDSDNDGNGTTWVGGEYGGHIDFKASNSNPIYGGSTTVQEESIQYPYFIQIATGQETENNIINEIELNNPYTLFDFKYTDALLYNLSWLRSTGAFYSNVDYPKAYEALQVETNTEITNGTTVQLPSGTSYTKRGLSVKLITETYTDYDFILNTTDETFRLPLKTKAEPISNAPVVGNGLSMMFTDGTNYGLLNDVSEDGDHGYLGWNGNAGTTQPNQVSVGTTITSRVIGNGNKAMGLTTDPVKSGLVADLSQGERSSDVYLYFYVGETVQNANLIDAGRIEEKIADIVPKLDGQVVYVDGAPAIFNQTALGDYEVDLSSILPNDGMPYALTISFLLTLPDTTGTNRKINIFDDAQHTKWIYAFQTDGGALGTGDFESTSVIFMTNPEHKLYVSLISTNADRIFTNAKIYLSNYRRLGIGG